MAEGVTPSFFFMVLEHGGGLPGSGGLPDPPDRPTADREDLVRWGSPPTPPPRSQSPSCLISLMSHSKVRDEKTEFPRRAKENV